VAAKLKANVDVRLIYDMQRALRLLSLRRDATLVRETLQMPEIKRMVETLLEPLMHTLRRVHRCLPLASVVEDLREFLSRLLDVLSGLRSRVQEPWRSVSTIATLLDDAVPAWYGVLHSLSAKDNLVEQLFAWLHSLARIIGSGTSDVSVAWAPPIITPSSASKPAPGVPQGGAVPLDELRRDLSELEAAARRRAVAEMRETCRWAAGDVDAYSPIQLQGSGGKTRTDPILAPPVKPAAPTPALDRFRPGFRAALARVLR
jgi:hypothetical protein